MHWRRLVPAGFQARLLTVLLVVSIIPLAVSAMVFFSLVNANIARETFERIAFARDAKKSEVTQYISFARRQAESLAQTNIARYSIGDFYGFSYAMSQMAPEAETAAAKLRELFGVTGDGSESPDPLNYDRLLREALAYANAHNQFHEEYQTFVASSEFDNVYLVNARGRVVYSVLKDDYLGRLLPREDTTLSRALAALADNPDDNGIVFYDFSRDTQTGRFSAYFVARVNLYQRSSGAAILRLPAEKLAALMGGREGANGTLSLISSRGTVIASSARNALPPGEPVTVPADMETPSAVAMLDTGLLGAPALSAWTHLRLPDASWLLAVDADAASAFAASRQLRDIILTVGALALPVILLLSLFLARSQTRPLKSVTDAAEAVAAGALDMRLPRFDQPTEFARLSQAVGRMRDALREQVKLISQKNRELEEHISQVAEKNVALEQADRMKDQFLANTSHELRTPLNGIIGISETLSAGAAGDIAPAQRNQLQLITFSARRLSRLVDDLLDLYRIRQGRMRLDIQAVDVATGVRQVLLLSEPLLSGEPVSLRVDIPDETPPVMADPVRFEQILYNLIGNAIKYVDDGHIHVTAWQDGDAVAVAVEDTGRGISPDNLERIFQPLEQADNIDITQKKSGTGLGLAIARNLAALLGGTLTATSEVGQGSRFVLRLPAAGADAAEQARGKYPGGLHQTINPLDAFETPAPSDGGADAPTIVVVDDEPINLQVLRNVLLPQGYRVISADNGRAGIEAVRENKPDLVILDVMMNDMSGLEVARALRRQHSLIDLPIIMVTARSRTRDMISGFEAGANDYVVKPFVKDELLTRISTLIEARRARSRAEENLALRDEVDRRIQVEDALRLSQRRMARLLDALEAGLVCVNDKSVVTYANRAAETIFGKPLDRATPLASLLPADIVNLLDSQCRADGESSATLHLAGREFSINAFELEPEAGSGMALVLSDASIEAESLLVSVRGAIDSALPIMAHEERNEPVSAAAVDEAYRALIVQVMAGSLNLWRRASGKDRIEFAEESGIWRVSLDKTSLQTRTLDKYLLIETLPLNPRWRDVIRSAEFALSRGEALGRDADAEQIAVRLAADLARLREHLRLTAAPKQRHDQPHDTPS
ncbi:response regulator [Nitratireductor pacificus]|uniref:histidine kinase n=1 Tax=Nitratireductor pacificus pht-3B TaxID=391937 RepID=K2MRQ5_9HYPH|nr:response regulator [Nitratireductor pacificus]EKF20017.1 multi-sensor hybrid histidine kinase [Nitratireductor pacificus pht-3B]